MQITHVTQGPVTSGISLRHDVPTVRSEVVPPLS